MKSKSKKPVRHSRFALQHNLDRIAALEKENAQLRNRLVVVSASAAMYLDQLLIASGVDTGGLDG